MHKSVCECVLVRVCESDLAPTHNNSPPPPHQTARARTGPRERRGKALRQGFDGGGLNFLGKARKPSTAAAQISQSSR